MDPIRAGLRAWEMKSGGRCDPEVKCALSVAGLVLLALPVVLLPNFSLVMLLRGPRVLGSTPQPVLGHLARRSQTHTLPALGCHPQGLSS